MQSVPYIEILAYTDQIYCAFSQAQTLYCAFFQHVHGETCKQILAYVGTRSTA